MNILPDAVKNVREVRDNYSIHILIIQYKINIYTLLGSIQVFNSLINVEMPKSNWNILALYLGMPFGLSISE